jgi:hypothetical protein
MQQLPRILYCIQELHLTTIRLVMLLIRGLRALRGRARAGERRRLSLVAGWHARKVPCPLARNWRRGRCIAIH